MRYEINRRRKRLAIWHQWFAWYPVVAGFPLVGVWLEPVWRRKAGSHTYYRLERPTGE